ncbi:hypothetical protein SDC9_170353 [bioreactor metagenome]|uniref:Uncharacterized protein n=1 Tax=bioreactor metagenome TaxID=1076179 RepID=A0A645G7V5_9ZZZZ
MCGGQQDLRHLFAVHIGWGRNGQHHACHGIRQRPVDELLGDKRFVRHDDLFAVPVADGRRAGIDLRYAACQIANGHGVTNTNRLFKQDDQAGDKVGENFLQTKAQTDAECRHQPLQFRPLNPDHREAHQTAN